MMIHQSHPQKYGNNPTCENGQSYSSNVLSYTLTGLAKNTTYYFTLQSHAMEPECVITSSYLTSVILNAAAGEIINIYNPIGQKIMQYTTTEGENRITVHYQGILIVRIGSETAKVVVR